MIIAVIANALGFIYGCAAAMSDSCGIDNSGTNEVQEGTANMETYPWMGLLIYPFDAKNEENRKTATLVLITTELALATALEIDKYPKYDFRAKSRVVLGHNCSGPYIGVLEYTYHPDFSLHYYSALAMVQLEVIKKQEYIPLCPPSTEFQNPDIYAITVAHDCTTPMLRIYKMKFVALEECRDYYRRNDLDVQGMWPRHVVCAQGLHGGECLWRSGTVLITKQYDRWRLLGIGIYGPGCEATARFLDYGMYHNWIQKTLARIGKVAVTRIAPDHLIIRRSGSRIQRYGPCDKEEMQIVLFTDYTHIRPDIYFQHGASGVARYNLTILSKTDYSCIILQAEYPDNDLMDGAVLKLRRWCHSKIPVCYESQYTTIFFYVEIHYRGGLTYRVYAFGKPSKKISTRRVMHWVNSKRSHPGMNSLKEYNPYDG